MIRPLTQTPDSPAGANTRAAAVSFLVAAAALFAQVLVHRLISAKLLNNVRSSACPCACPTPFPSQMPPSAKIVTMRSWL